MNGGIDPAAWIELVGIPKIEQLEEDVKGLKQSYWIAVGGGMVIGVILAASMTGLIKLFGSLV